VPGAQSRSVSGSSEGGWLPWGRGAGRCRGWQPTQAKSLAGVRVWLGSAGPMAGCSSDTAGAGPGSAAQHPAAPAVLLGCCGPPRPPAPGTRQSPASPGSSSSEAAHLKFFFKLLSVAFKLRYLKIKELNNEGKNDKTENTLLLSCLRKVIDQVRDTKDLLQQLFSAARAKGSCLLFVSVFSD